MKQTIACRAIQDEMVMVERSEKLQYSCLENTMNSMKSQKDRTLKDELPRSVGDLYIGFLIAILFPVVQLSK